MKGKRKGSDQEGREGAEVEDVEKIVKKCKAGERRGRKNDGRRKGRERERKGVSSPFFML